MPKYMILASYTAEGLRGLKKDGPAVRRHAVQALVEGVGGKLEAMYWSLGEHDVVLIADVPSLVKATSCAMAASATGMIRTTTVPLLGEDEVKQALAETANFRPPGG